MSTVSGVVKSNGEVVTEGYIMFYPSDGGRPSVGNIGPDGRYELMSLKKGDGALHGSHKVTITANKEIRDPNAPAAPESIEEETEENMSAATSLVWLFPERFSELRTSPLTAVVKKGEENVINFDSADFDSE